MELCDRSSGTLEPILPAGRNSRGEVAAADVLLNKRPRCPVVEERPGNRQQRVSRDLPGKGTLGAERCSARMVGIELCDDDRTASPVDSHNASDPVGVGES